MKHSFDDVFKDMDNVFKEMDKVFKAMDKRMDEVMAGAAESNPEPWQKWFAWHPVTIKGKRRWMQTVYRRNTLEVCDTGLRTVWKYGDMFDVLKEAGNGS